MTDTVGNDALQAASQVEDKLRVTLTGSQQLQRGAPLRRPAYPAGAPGSNLLCFLLRRAARTGSRRPLRPHCSHSISQANALSRRRRALTKEQKKQRNSSWCIVHMTPPRNLAGKGLIFKRAATLKRTHLAWS